MCRREVWGRRRGGALLGVVWLLLAAWGGPTWGQGRPADLLVTGAGTSAAGQAMTVACALTLAAVPSNQYLGRCRITLGGDVLTLGGLPGGDAAKLLTVVLNGAVTLRGVAEEGTGQFGRLVQHGSAGFPLQVLLDPLGRAWVIRSDIPGGGSQTVASGALTRGTVIFAVQ